MANRVLLVVLTAVAIWPVSSSELREDGLRHQSKLKRSDRAMLLQGPRGENYSSHQDSNGRVLLSLSAIDDPSNSKGQFEDERNFVNEIPLRVKDRPLNTPRDGHASSLQHKGNLDMHVHEKIGTRRYQEGHDKKRNRAVHEAAEHFYDGKTLTAQNYDNSSTGRENEIIPGNMEVVYTPSKNENVVVFSSRISQPVGESLAKDSPTNPSSSINNDGMSPNGNEGVSLSEPQNTENYIINYQNEENEKDRTRKVVPGEVSTFLRAIQQRQLALAQARMGATKSSVPKSIVSQGSAVNLPSLTLIPPGPRPASFGEETVVSKTSPERPRRTRKNTSRESTAEYEHVKSKENNPSSDENNHSRDEELHPAKEQDYDGNSHELSSTDDHPPHYSMTIRKLGSGAEENLRSSKIRLPEDEETILRKLNLSDDDYSEDQHRQHDEQPTEKFIADNKISSKSKSFDRRDMPSAARHYQVNDKSPVRGTNFSSHLNKNASKAPIHNNMRTRTSKRLPKLRNDEVRIVRKSSRDSTTSAESKRVSPTTTQPSRRDEKDSFESHVPRKGEKHTLRNTYKSRHKTQDTASRIAKTNQDLFNFLLKPQKTSRRKSETSYHPRTKEKKVHLNYATEPHSTSRYNDTKPRSSTVQKNNIPRSKQSLKEHPPISSTSKWSHKEKQTPQESHGPPNQINVEFNQPLKNEQQVLHESHKHIGKQGNISRRPKKPSEKHHKLHKSQKTARRKPQIVSKSGTPLKRQRSQLHKSHSAPPKRHQTARGSKHKVSKEPMKSSASGKNKKKGKSHGFKKSRKSAHKEAKGHKGNKGHTVKKGHKKIIDKEYDKDHKEKHHKKGSLEEDSAHHGQHHQGHYNKGNKGVSGHKTGSSKHQQKGHNEKGFKEVRHSKEYMVQKKHYKDVDDKEYHGDHDHFDKFFEKFKKGVFDAGSFLGDKHHKKHHKDGHHIEGHHHHHHKEHNKHHSDEGDHHHHSEHGHDEGSHEKHKSGDDGGGH